MLFNPVWVRLAPYGACLALAVLCWHFWHRAVENANTVRVQAASFVQAQRDADREWANKFAAQQTAYDKETENAQRKYETALADARDATSAFIRMRAQAPASHAQGGPAPAATETPGVPAAMPSGVVMDEADVRACANLYVYAVNAHDWAVGLLQNEAPQPAK